MSQSSHQTTCAYCGVGCGVELPRLNDRRIKVSGDASHPANAGRLCVKGTHLGDVLPLKQRLLYPQIDGQRTDWDQTIETIAKRIRTVRAEHGPEAIGFYLSGQLLTEDYYAANKLAKGFIGTANVDTNSRLCMSSAVAAHIRAFGEDAPPISYDDIELADLIVLVGSNLAWTHPVLFQRLQQARQANPNKKLVVIDPRRTSTAKEADLHLPIAPGHDGQLFNALLSYLADNLKIDHDYVDRHVDGYSAALTCATSDAGDSLSTQAERTGLSKESLNTFFKWFAATDKTTTVWSMGINQSESGVDKANAIINVHLATGRIGKPGATAFSITGQPNAMGGREVGGLANQLAAHRMFDKESIQTVAQFWQAPNIATEPGLKAVELFDACRNGQIKFLWIMGTNPVASMPDADHIREALKQVETVVVSDVVTNTDTLPFADIQLPAQVWGEKDGTVTNSERTISRQRAFLIPPGQALADWQALARVGKALGYSDAFDWHHAHEIFREHAQLSAINTDTPLQFDLSAVANLSFRDYQDWQPRQWPLDGRADSKRLFADGQFSTPSGKASMIAVQARKPNLPGEGRLLLNTGRLRDQWHTMSRTGLAVELNRHSPRFEVHIHPADAALRGIANGELTKLHSDVGECYAYARHETAQQRGQIFAPMHWNRTFASHGGAARLIAPLVDPISGQPASKHSQVSVRAVATEVSGFLFVRDDQDTPDWLTDTINFTQPSRQGRLIQFEVTKQHYDEWRVVLSGYHTLQQQAAQWTGAQSDDRGLTHWCSVGSDNAIQPDIDYLDHTAITEMSQLNHEELAEGVSNDLTLLGQRVCTCFSVTDRQIQGFCQQNPKAGLSELQAELKCGTNCGSCVGEIKELMNTCPKVGAE